jgi:DNA-binding GntR family transcriptional regulator
MALRDTVFARQERYSRIFLSSEVHDAAALMNNMKEHRLIKDAALARDADHAASQLLRHLQGTRESLVKWLANRQARARQKTRVRS